MLEFPPPPPPPPPPVPVASFTFSSNPVPRQANITFTNTSKNATSYIWDFGDGSGEDNTTSPTHSYQQGGLYNVTLISEGEGGIDRITKIVTVPNPPTTCTIQKVQIENHSITTSIDQGTSYPDLYFILLDKSGFSYSTRNSYFLNVAPSVKRQWTISPSAKFSPLNQEIKLALWDYDDISNGDADDIIETFIIKPLEYTTGAGAYPSTVLLEGDKITCTIYLSWN